MSDSYATHDGEETAKRETSPGLRRIAILRRCWHVAALSKQVTKARRRPLSVVVCNLPMILVRDHDGIVRAFLDRCPHRNVPLNGADIQGETLSCPYHGWAFDLQGCLKSIPSSTKKLPNYSLSTLAVHEGAGFIWVYPDTSESLPACAPLPLPLVGAPGYQTIQRRIHAECSVHAFAENALDVPHTAILHRGLFRSGATHEIRATTRIFEQWVETQYHDEPLPTGILAQLLGLQARGEEAVLLHWDRFIAPGVIQVEYQLGSKSHFQITAFCTPKSESETTLFASASFKTPLPDKLLALLLEPIARIVLSQDLKILRAQQKNIEKFGGETFMSTPLDVMGGPIWHILKHSRKLEAQGKTSQPETNLLENSINTEPKRVHETRLIT